jgi:hypothetical protein
MLQTGWVQASEESLHYGRFGKVTLYRESPHPLHLVLFVSCDPNPFGIENVVGVARIGG